MNFGEYGTGRYLTSSECGIGSLIRGTPTGDSDLCDALYGSLALEKALPGVCFGRR